MTLPLTLDRKKVLKHHPDKKAAENPDDDDIDAFFKCIQKAWEVLTDAERRRQFESVDPSFDESIPAVKPKGDFYEVYGDAFGRNERYVRAGERSGRFNSSILTVRTNAKHFQDNTICHITFNYSLKPLYRS